MNILHCTSQLLIYLARDLFAFIYMHRLFLCYTYKRKTYIYHSKYDTVDVFLVQLMHTNTKNDITNMKKENKIKNNKMSYSIKFPNIKRAKYEMTNILFYALSTLFY